MKVSVYRNLHNGLISIKSASSGLVLGHAKSVDISGADFVVNEAGRQRVLRDRQKNVHAYVKGLLLNTIGFTPYKGRSLQRCKALGAIHSTYKDTIVSYNPYKQPYFVIKGTTDKVSKARLCTVSHDGIISGYRVE